jgi:predicted metal-dependent enzyme (double-stranded beta helix superfamily)
MVAGVIVRKKKVFTRKTLMLRDLIAEVTSTVAKCVDEKTVSERLPQILRRYLGRTDILTPEQMEACSSHYKQRILHVSRDRTFSIVALVWLPGQATPVQNHIAWCVTGVHLGCEEERRYWCCEVAAEQRPVQVGRSINVQGSITSLLPPGDIHQVVNSGSARLVSLHIYDADIAQLGSSIKHRFSPPG